VRTSSRIELGLRRERLKALRITQQLNTCCWPKPDNPSRLVHHHLHSRRMLTHTRGLVPSMQRWSCACFHSLNNDCPAFDLSPRRTFAQSFRSSSTSD